jgi:hypothetical protein
LNVFEQGPVNLILQIKILKLNLNNLFAYNCARLIHFRIKKRGKNYFNKLKVKNLQLKENIAEWTFVHAGILAIHKTAQWVPYFWQHFCPIHGHISLSKLIYLILIKPTFCMDSNVQKKGGNPTTIQSHKYPAQIHWLFQLFLTLLGPKSINEMDFEYNFVYFNNYFNFDSQISTSGYFEFVISIQ